MDPAFMARLEDLRRRFARQMPLSSAYRCPTYNAQLSRTGQGGPHTTGRAIDVLVAYGKAYDLLGLALTYGFTGIGIKQKGHPNKRFLHLDDLTEADGFPRPLIWTY